eukprot:9487726-Pyramimonas_sp.AAC.2
MESSIVVERRNFRDFFASMQTSGPEGFASGWLDYAHFDECLQRCAESVKGGEGNEASCYEGLDPEDVRAQFLLELTDFLQTFFLQYESHKKYISAKKQGSAIRRIYNKALRSLNLDKVLMRSEEARFEKSNLTQEAFWFRTYAEVRVRVYGTVGLLSIARGSSLLTEGHACVKNMPRQVLRFEIP